MRKPFIAYNINPTSLKHLIEEIEKAQKLGFTHAWLNPIGAVPPDSFVEKTDPDTGIFTELRGCRYAVNDLREIDPRFASDEMRSYLKKKKEQGFPILCDFVWKHVDKNSSLVREHPDWFHEKTKKDIHEFNFTDENTDEILRYLKTALDIYIDEYGFSGIRIDASSQLKPPIKRELLKHIYNKKPCPIVYEELLYNYSNFNPEEERDFQTLIQEADTYGLKSDYVTSNLYYESPHWDGSLGHSDQIGDEQKTHLSHALTSFIGSHDHFSLPWGVILTLAAQQFIDENNKTHFFDTLHKDGKTQKTQLFYPKEKRPLIYPAEIKEQISIKKDGKYKHQKVTRNILSIIEDIADQKIMPGKIEHSYQRVWFYLLPFAHEVARSLLEPTELDRRHTSELMQQFTKLIFQRIIDRTLASGGGYYATEADINLTFNTSRVFYTATGEPLPHPLITPKDIAELPKETLTNLVADLREQKNLDGSLFLNKAAGFFNALQLPIKGHISRKNQVNTTDSFRILLPFIINHIRTMGKTVDCPGSQPSAKQYNKLRKKIGYDKYLANINEIFAHLTTLNSGNFETFVSLDQYKIIIRYDEDNTDIIIMNLKPTDEFKEFNELDLIKIAIWFQSRLFRPQQEDFRGNQQAGTAQPFAEGHEVYFNGSYAMRYEKDPEFAKSWHRILGTAKNHKTHLYLGCGINANQKSFPTIPIVIKGGSLMDLSLERTDSKISLSEAYSSSSPTTSPRIFTERPASEKSEKNETLATTFDR